MIVEELVAELEQLGIELEVVGDRLRYRAPRGVLTGELRARLVQHKAELLAFLHNQLGSKPEAHLPTTGLVAPSSREETDNEPERGGLASVEPTGRSDTPGPEPAATREAANTGQEPGPVVTGRLAESTAAVDLLQKAAQWLQAAAEALADHDEDPALRPVIEQAAQAALALWEAAKRPLDLKTQQSLRDQHLQPLRCRLQTWNAGVSSGGAPNCSP